MSDAHGAVVVEGDAAEALGGMPDGSVDLVVSSPPYGIGKAYERGRSRLDRDGYVAAMRAVLAEVVRALRRGGSICWQTGSAFEDGALLPLDVVFTPILADLGMTQRSRAVWTFGSGLHATRRFSGRHEMMTRWQKGSGGTFNAGAIEVATPLGDGRYASSSYDPSEAFAPTAIWDVPNVKAGHPERTGHPCPFPSELPRRCILALTRPGDLVLDPFLGTGTTAVAAIVDGRRAIGIERDAGYAAIARRRIATALRGETRLRPFGPPATPRVAAPQGAP